MGMKRDHSQGGTLVPVAGFLSDEIAKMPELQQADMPQHDLLEFSPLLDSSNMGPDDWAKIGRTIFQQYDAYDGFVVVHGTDTMAYTASALSFMYENLDKPIILTGSQVPFCEPYNDARRNLIVSVICAGILDVHEVCIFFNDRLMRGNRSVKIDNDGLAAFESPNFPPLAQLGVGITVDETLFLARRNAPALIGRSANRSASSVTRADAGEVGFSPDMESNIAVLRLVPGFDDECIERIAQGSTKAIVLMLYGTGNAPDSTIKKGAFINALASAAKRLHIVICSQCSKGSTDLRAYAVGRQLMKHGVMSGGDMTIEAVVTKLGHLLARPGLRSRELRRLWAKSLRGERSGSDVLVRPPRGLVARRRRFPRLSKHELRTLWGTMDADKDGFVDEEAFVSALRDIGPRLAAARRSVAQIGTGAEAEGPSTPVQSAVEAPAPPASPALVLPSPFNARTTGTAPASRLRLDLLDAPDSANSLTTLDEASVDEASVASASPVNVKKRERPFGFSPPATTRDSSAAGDATAAISSVCATITTPPSTAAVGLSAFLGAMAGCLAAAAVLARARGHGSAR
jgi:L-asparaginase